MFFQFMPCWFIDSSFFEVLILLYSLVCAAFVYSLSAFSPFKFCLHGEIFVSNSWLLKNRDKPRPNTLSIYGSLHFVQDTVRELEGEIARLEKEKASLNVALTNKKSEASDR